MAFVGLLFVFSYNLLRVWDTDSLSALEYVLCVWFGTLLIEELRQVDALARAACLRSIVGLPKRHCVVFRCLEQARHGSAILCSAQLIVLQTIYILFIFGIAYRVTNLGSARQVVESKAIFAILAILLWLRLARYYAVSEQIGPKVATLIYSAIDAS